MIEPARGGRSRADAGRARARRRARRRRRRHRGPRDLRARQPLAHRRDRASAAITSPTTSRSACARRFPRRRRSSGGRLRAVGDGRRGRDDRSRQRRRPPPARDGATHPLATSCSRAPRRSSTWSGTRSPRPATRSRSTPGLVLTGGGAMLEGMSEIAEQIFDLPIRRGCRPASAASRITSATPRMRRRSDWCATPSGIVQPAAESGGGALTRVMGRLRTVFKEFF